MPPEANRDHASLVDEARVVLLVRASATQNALGCSLTVTRVLKGHAPQVLPVLCRLPASGDWMTDFSAHHDKTFWRGDGGRLGINGDCSVIGPAFTPGKSYLILLGIKPDVKQFEQIGGRGDRWLEFVRARIRRSG